MCRTIVITTTEEANQMLEILDRAAVAARVDNYASERAKKIRRLRCCCCDQDFRGRQWWNQDCGYGLGDCCARHSEVDPITGEDFSHGVPGIHFLIPESDTPHTRDR